jgi:hypothetical protein
MAPQPGSIEARLDMLERRQDDRHRENCECIRELRQKLDPIATQVASLTGGENYRGRVGEIESDVGEIKREQHGMWTVINKIDRSMARWGGMIIGAVAVVQVVIEIVFKWLIK